MREIKDKRVEAKDEIINSWLIMDIIYVCHLFAYNNNKKVMYFLPLVSCVPPSHCSLPGADHSTTQQ